MRIQHNIAAMNSHRALNSNSNATAKNLEKLSSGFKINRAGDDAAGLAISEKMRSQIRGLETAQKNANDGISLIQTAEGALTEVHSMLNRMVELATQASNGTYDNSDRAKLQSEVESLNNEIDRIAGSTNFNGIKLLDGNIGGKSVLAGASNGVNKILVNGGSNLTTDTFKFTGGTAGQQAGATLELGAPATGITFAMTSTSGNGDKGSITFKAVIDESTASAADIEKFRGLTVTIEHDAITTTAVTSGAYQDGTGGTLSLQVGDTAAQQVSVAVGNMGATQLGTRAISVATEDGAKAAIEAINNAINTVSTTRSDLGAIQNRLEHTISNLGVTTENLTAAESRIRDVDMASEMMTFTKNNILQQAAQAMLAQANQQPQGVLQLLR